MVTHTYRPITADQIPADIVWDTPQRCAGQIIEVAYGRPQDQRAEADEGANYKRVTDRSVGPDAHAHYQRDVS